MNQREETLKKLNMMLYSHHTKIRKVAEKYNIHFGQMPILQYIMKFEGCNQKDIASNLCVSLPSISTSIKRMERNNLLIKKIAENDQRTTQIYLTKKGLSLINNCLKDFDLVDTNFFKILTDEDFNSLNLILDKLLTSNPIEKERNVDYDKKTE